jgi:quercetin dioxygenase-like cupin family protein
MELKHAYSGAIDLTVRPVHLGLQSRAYAVDGFAWDRAALDAYALATESDGADGRMVMVFESAESWTTWERHPFGDEIVVCLTGSFNVIRDADGVVDSVVVSAGHAMINPAGCWHTVDVVTPSTYMTVTPGLGTEHRNR